MANTAPKHEHMTEASLQGVSDPTLEMLGYGVIVICTDCFEAAKTEAAARGWSFS